MVHPISPIIPALTLPLGLHRVPRGAAQQRSRLPPAAPLGRAAAAAGKRRGGGDAGEHRATWSQVGKAAAG